MPAKPPPSFGPKMTPEGEAMVAAWNRAKKVEATWRQGLLDWKLDVDQRTMREVLRTTVGDVVVRCARQKGKSFWLCIEAIEFALNVPGAQIKYACPTAKMVRKIIRPHFRKILADCPKDLRPVFNSQDGEYRFPSTGAVITIAGTDRDNIETLRGQHAHLAIVDEGGFMDNLEYVIDSVLGPQLQNTNGRLIIASTPAPTPGHPFRRYCEGARVADGMRRREFFGQGLEGENILVGFDEGLLIHRTLYTNPRLSRKNWERSATRCEQDKISWEKGIQTSTWKREYLCEEVTDEKMAVLPAATEGRLRAITLKTDDFGKVVGPPRRPPMVHTYIGVDLGFHPHRTGIVGFEWWYQEAAVVFLGERLLDRGDTGSIVAAILDLEAELWPFPGPQPYPEARVSASRRSWEPYRRVSDNDLKFIADMHLLHGLPVCPTAKDNKQAAVNNLNLALKGEAGQVWLHPRCKYLRRQFAEALWNKQRTELAEEDGGGHYDLLDAAVYGNRNVDRHANPVPADLHQRGYDMVVVPARDTGSLGAQLRNLFGMSR